MVSHEIRALRLVDVTGSFGVHNGHCDFLTLLVPAIGTYYDADGDEHYLAIDGGIFKIFDNRATLTSGEIFEDNDLNRLAVIIRDDFLRRDSAEQRIEQIVEGIESSFFEKLANVGKEGAR
jgi:F-type H+-transporting ATPase subunit epsilon